MQYVSKLDLDEPQNDIQSTDKAHEFPIPLLPVQDGLICKHEGCLHLCVSVKRVRSHWVAAMVDLLSRLRIGVLSPFRLSSEAIF